jgi:MipA family protein
MDRKASQLIIALGFIAAGPTVAETEANASRGWHLDGDVGLGVFSKQSIVRGKSARTSVLPYVFADYGPLFGRVDTFGLKTLPIGYGHLEISTRVMRDGIEGDASATGLRERKDSQPLGLSTFQITPYGAFALIALHDFGDSKGRIVDANWTGKIPVAAWLALYPQLGAEHLSARYVDYYYGVGPGDTGFAAYDPGGALNRYLALYADSPLGQNVSLTLAFRQKWLGGAIADSPFVTGDRQRNAYAAVTYRFK